MGRPVKVPQLLIGHAPVTPPVTVANPNKPATIPSGGTGLATGLFTQQQSNFEGCIGVNVNWTGGTLTLPPTIQYFWSPDEATFFEDKAVPTTCNTVTPGAIVPGGVDLGPYFPPRPSKQVKLVVKNLDTSRPIQVLAIGGSTDYTVGGFGAAGGD